MDYAGAPIASRVYDPRGFFHTLVRQPIPEQRADHSRMRVAGSFVAQIGSIIHVKSQLLGPCAPFKSFVRIRKRNDLEVKMKTIRIKDYYGIYQEIPVSDELYEEWRTLQNETQRVHRKEVYHRDWTPIEDLFEMPKSYEQNPMEDTLLWDEQVAALYAAIAQLTPIQQRRIHMLMENMTIREIARQEGCHMNAALKSVNGALKKLHDLLKDWA